jgi:hypothetical protein
MEKNSDPGSAINISDPQHWDQQMKYGKIGWNLCRILLGEFPTMFPLLLLLPMLRVRLELGDIFLILDTS